MRVYVTGAAGNLGRRLMAGLQAAAHSAIGVDVDTVDVTDYAALLTSMAHAQPDVVINCAAWTDVDGCAREPHKAIRINGVGAHNVALAAAACGAEIVHISTNEVFDGRGGQPYAEYDRTQPINPYGYSKWYAEQAILTTTPRHYIVRTAWLFAHGGRNFIHAILNVARQGKPLRIVTDEIGNPTYNDDLADAILRLIETRRYGIYHLTNSGYTSRYHFAQYFLERAGYGHLPITPISTREWSRPSRPPTYAALANHAAAAAGIQLRTWQAAVDAYLLAEGL